jgi:hypothetical protein
MVFGFLLHAKCLVKKNFEARSKLKVGGGCLWAYMYAYNSFFEKFQIFWFVFERLKS